MAWKSAPDAQGVFEEDALGDLKLQQARSNAGLPDDVGEVGYEGGLIQLPGGDVDAEQEVAPGGLLETAMVGAGLAQRPQAHGDNDAGLFR